MLQELLQRQQQNLNYYFEHLDLEEVQAVLDLCEQTQGLIVLTGVGKSGIIAEKIAATLISTGTKALYLPPTNFLHGDMGILSKNDLFVLLSRSGETEELLNLISFAKKRNTPLLAITSNKESRLARLCDTSISLPFETELCPFDLAPTSSTTVQLLFGDLLAIALMQKKGFILESFLQNHPAGALGKKMAMTVDEIMLTGEQLPVVRPHHRLIDSLVELSNKKCGALLIADENEHLVGVFTDGDLRRMLQTQGSEVLESSLKDLMTKSPLSIQKGSLAWDALKVMQKDPKKLVMMLPVLEGNKVEGILHMHSIIHAGIV